MGSGSASVRLRPAKYHICIIVTIYVSHSPDVFSKGIWPEIHQIDGPESKELAESLPAIAL